MSAGVKFEAVSTPLFKETPFSKNFITSEKESGEKGKAEECAALLQHTSLQTILGHSVSKTFAPS